MGVLQIEVVVGAIEVGRHGGQVAGAILTVVGTAHGNPGNLSHCVCIVGRLQRPGEQAFLFHRLWRHLRINAGAAEEKKPFHTGQVCIMDHVVLDHQVIVNEFRWIAVVGHDTPTFAAARKTYSGFSWAKNSETAAWFLKSSSLLVRRTKLV